jgi:phosphohistidine phosphatase
MPLNKILIILRHGQAKNAGISEHDHNRSLTLRGREEAMGAGEALADRDFVPDLVLCSTATRTRETLEEIQNSFPEELPVTYSQKIYNATEVDLLANIAVVPEDVRTLMVIGHNPGLYQLALVLAKEGDKQMHNNLQMQFPTCALVVISFEGKWQDILNSRSKLLLFHTPEK